MDRRSDFIPDYNPSDSSFQIGGTIKTNQNITAMALDTVLTGFSESGAPDTPTTAVNALRGFLTQTPLGVLQMFRPFVFGSTEADWEDQYSAVEKIMGTFQPKKIQAAFQDWVTNVFDPWKAAQDAKKSEWIADFELKTGLNVDEGPVKFLQSLQALQAANRLDWITEFEAKSGLNIDAGTSAFLQSLLLKLNPTYATKAELAVSRDAWITDFEAKTGLEIDSGASAFLASLLQKIAGNHPTHGDVAAATAAWVAEFELKTGLDIDAGAAKFLQSLIAKLNPTYATKTELTAAQVAWIADFETRTGLDIDAGAAAFLTSLLAKLKPEWAKDTAPIGTKLQELLDGIKSIFTPGSTNTPVKDAIEVILGLKDKTEIAQAAADRANMDIAVLVAAQNGGFADEFDYPDAKELPNNAAAPLPSWAVTYKTQAPANNVLTWGPDGRGVLVYKANGIAGTGNRTVTYREKNHPQAGATGTLTLQLSKQMQAATNAEAHICWHMSATDQSCNRLQIKFNKLQLQTVDAAGNPTDVGAAVTIPNVVEGTTFVVKYTATQVEVLRNKISDMKVSYTPLAGQYIGFGAYSPVFLGVGAINPNASFKGIAFHP